MIDTLRLTAEEAKRLLDKRRGLRRRASRRLPRRDRRAQRRAALLPDARRRRRQRRRADRAQGRHLDEGRAHDGRLEDPRGLCPGLRLDRRGPLQGRRAAAARQDEHRRVRNGLLDRELGVRAFPQSLGPDARSRRLGWRFGRSRVGGPRAGALGSTPAVRSNSPRRSAATWACVRPTERFPATGSSPSRPASTRSAR